MVSKIWVGISTINIIFINLLQFKSQSLAKTRTLNFRHTRTHTKEKPSQFSNITSAILPLTKLRSWMHNLYFANLNLNCVTYAQPIPLPLSCPILSSIHLVYIIYVIGILWHILKWNTVGLVIIHFPHVFDETQCMLKLQTTNKLQSCEMQLRAKLHPKTKIEHI